MEMLNPELKSDTAQLGMSLMEGVGTFGVWSDSATEISVNILDPEDSSRVIHKIPLAKADAGIFSLSDERFLPGIKYVLRAAGPEGPRHAFDKDRNLLDPYAKGLIRENPKDYHCVAVSQDFDWQGVKKPGTALSETIIYEAHLRGLTRINPNIDPEIRGSYAALGHPATINYLLNLGITAIELLPIQAYISEPRLVNLGLLNYWGYNTINFFTPHMRYASRANRDAGPEAIALELKTAIRELHRAGIEVLMDVVYNHSAEGGHKGLTYSYRGLDNSSYYRQDDEGNYHDTTGCGNSFDFSNPMVQRLTLDSLRYWASEYQIDGFRFDLATTLARDEHNNFDKTHPLLDRMQIDPVIRNTKLIVEPWDVGLGGWQTGNFAPGFSEWNDKYRDSVRKFWLSDVSRARQQGQHNNGVQELAGMISGSQEIMKQGSPLKSVNFITAHDGFTLNDLVSYDAKQNADNGEHNRDGANNNSSFNHGPEGVTNDESVNAQRRKAARNLMGTLLLSAGVPMIAAGDERLKTQNGNNNAYCQDNAISWLDFSPSGEQLDFEKTVVHLIALRKKYPALRPRQFTTLSPPTSELDQMLWFSALGDLMSVDDWHNQERRTLQRLSYNQNQDGSKEGLLLVISGSEKTKSIILPSPEDVTSFELLWDSSLETPPLEEAHFGAGSNINMSATSMQLFLIH
ncbi:glycogen debranching protein GlgX [Candidatus Aquiluna sp. UB-MaderosW2red]|uniref:glycogen debranching protein GlgX n=1 Tax=Candidatus Aquiluna sp. UB-MaderosW2red TaxID=1855377 RepID=UPI000875B741|nr:glycogen debranching protein GlgX [Candidatus Aquiluna sp. UB-MaderosW2red]SCX09707.1 glycogen operon protein [Candidatus Aquiluna sp. UB-MaderosW2red]